MIAGDTVKFVMYDSFIGVTIHGTGILMDNIWGKVWRIMPKPHLMLSGGEVQLHENSIALEVK